MMHRQAWACLTRSKGSTRGIGLDECPAMIEKQNQAAAVAVGSVAVGAAAAVCANNDGCGYTPAADWDQFYGPYGHMCGLSMWSHMTTGQYDFRNVCS